jgi:hypothetical protein
MLLPDEGAILFLSSEGTMSTSSPSRDDDDQIPLDAVHQCAYCPRRAYLMHHDGRWGDNEYTEEGRLIHRRVDERDEVLPAGSALP